MANISDLRFDDKNFNQHTEYGMSLLEKSLRENGAGRSILIDKDNNIIAGNGIIEAAGNIGLEDLQIIETDGSKIVAVKRTDIALDSAQGRQMALADNATAAIDLSWDEDNIREEADKWGFDPNEWGDLFKPRKEIIEDDPDDIDTEHTYSKPGTIYQLGEHRVYCGSFEDSDKVDSLFGKDKATCTFTDPPYNVAVKSRTTGKTIKNDNMKEDAFQFFLDRAFDCVASHSIPGAGVISWMSDKVIINPLGDWTGGVNVDSGATNRKLGSDMGRAVTGGGLHGKDLSKADVALNIYAHLKAQTSGHEVNLCCAIGDTMVDGKPYAEIVEIARQYINGIGGFEKLAEWGLI